MFSTNKRKLKETNGQYAKRCCKVRDKNFRTMIDHRGKGILNVGNRINLFDMYLKSRTEKQVRRRCREVFQKEIDRALADVYLNM